MYLIVVGGGPTGASLVELAVDEGHDVTLIEAEAGTAEALAERFDVRVLHASIAEGEILEEAEAHRADALVATTEDDSSNLMAMVLGLEAEVDTLVSIVNDAHHRRLFERLGVHVLLDPEVIVAHHLYGIVCRPEMEESVTLPGGGYAFELVLAEGAALAGRTLGDAREAALIADDVVVAWVRRDEKTLAPAPEVRLESGDRLTVFSPEPLSDRQLEAFRGSRDRQGRG